MLKFLDENAGLINTILAAIITTSTIVYVFLTRMIVLETRKTRRAQTEPRIAVYVEPSVSIHLLDLVVRNIGADAAYNIQFRIISDFEYESGKKFSSLRFLSSGLRYLAPEQRFTFFLTSLLEDYEQKKKTPLMVRVTYQSRDADRYEEDFTMDFAEADGVTFIERRTIEDVARELEKLRTEVGKIALNIQG